MKVKAIRKLHPMKFEEGRLLMNRWVVKTLDLLQFEMPGDVLAVLLDINPNLFQDADSLAERLLTLEANKTIKLNDTDIYTMYLGYDMLGRMLSSSYREKVLNAFNDEGKETLTAEVREKLYRFAKVNIAPIIDDTETYARQFNCLKLLPEIKRKLKRMPLFD